MLLCVLKNRPPETRDGLGQLAPSFIHMTRAQAGSSTVLTKFWHASDLQKRNLRRRTNGRRRCTFMRPSAIDSDDGGHRRAARPRPWPHRSACVPEHAPQEYLCSRRRGPDLRGSSGCTLQPAVADGARSARSRGRVTLGDNCQPSAPPHRFWFQICG